MKNVPIDVAGHWLREDAAASYRRMLAAGMPAGGIASAGRTRAEQAALYAAYLAGRGNLAAKPGTSKHETGRALDITRGTRAHTWATTGGRPLTVRSAEQIRAHLFGWRRDVPTEAWHLVYSPTTDRSANLPILRPGARGDAVRILQLTLSLTTDGIYGPKTAQAVRNRQTATGLTPDAITGPKTWVALHLA